MSDLKRQEAAQPSQRSQYERIIRPSGGVPRVGWAELWEYRGLFGALATRTFKVRYKQTIAGSLWALIQPLVTMLILTVIFGKLAGFDDGKNNYPLLVLSGVLPWQLFASSLTQSATSLVSSAGMISKVYFPRLIVPASSCIVGLADFVIALAILAIMMLVWQQSPSWGIVLIPGFTFLALLAALGIGLWLSALNVRFRDIRHIVPFLAQIGLYVSPVGFPSSRVPKAWRKLYAINPMVFVIDGFRWALLGNPRLNWEYALISAGSAFFVFITGIYFFRFTESSFADHV